MKLTNPTLKKMAPYSFAFLITIFILLVRLKLLTYAPTQHPSMLLAVALSAWLGGLGPGILSSIFASILYLYYFIPPNDSFKILTTQDTIQFLGFSVTAVIIGSLTGALKQARKNAADLEKRRNQVLANLSHEVRTPLASILGIADMLRNEHNLTARTKLTEALKEAGQALSALIEDLFDISKMDCNQIKINRTEFSLESNLQNVLETFSPRILEKNIELNLSLDFDIPTRLVGDWTRLRQILMILLDNAIKFSPEHSDVTVKFQNQGTTSGICTLSISVEDHGLGIPQHLTAKIFEPFFQVDPNSSRKHAGAGLGLSICKRLVEVLGGEIKVQSTLGKGTIFTLLLPFEIAGEKQISQKNMTDRSEHLLVVEDHAICRIIVAEQLKKLGFKADVVSSAKEAYVLLEENPYSGILMDCHMPGIDGYEAARHITRLQQKGELQSIPIIAMTADTNPKSTTLREESGMVDIILKPIFQEKLNQVLDR